MDGNSEQYQKYLVVGYGAATSSRPYVERLGALAFKALIHKKIGMPSFSIHRNF